MSPDQTKSQAGGISGDEAELERVNDIRWEVLQSCVHEIGEARSMDDLIYGLISVAQSVSTQVEPDYPFHRELIHLFVQMINERESRNANNNQAHEPEQGRLV